MISRRDFVAASALVAAVPPLGCRRAGSRVQEEAPLFRISLAQWSLHRALEGGTLDPLDFPRIARDDFGLDAVEYVSVFYRDAIGEAEGLGELKRRADDAGVRSLLIMVDGEGDLGDPDEQRRRAAVENHHKWVEATRRLGGHSIRVNARSQGTQDDQRALAADGLGRLTEFADGYDLNVLVENHGGLSSNGAWLAGVIRAVDHPRCGTLPDFGNFHIADDLWYDRYRGVKELMPFAKAVSAKSEDFDETGNETRTNYRRMMKIVLDAGYRGYVGIEYEGPTLSEPEGIKATKALLERVRQELAPAYERP